ncbi:MAG: hypothetical protein AB1750_10050 [Chloroflexota bacterium]
MENPPPALVVLIGLSLRIGIPVIITVIAVLILRKVDARWKAEAEALPPEPPAAIVEKPSCWEVIECAPELMKDCPAPVSPLPCWQARRQKNGYLMEKCLTCQVFRQAPLPTPAPFHA